MFVATPTDEGNSEQPSFLPILAAVESFVASVEPRAYTGEAAASLTKALRRAEKLCGNAAALMAARAKECRTHDTHGRTSTESWYGGLGGTPVGRARSELAMADRLDDQPELEEALRSGDVSASQAALIGDALAADPEAAVELIGSAKRDSYSVLRDRC
ncbi:MAG: hypothetical protein ACRDZT_07650, partial [Acidimicrobiales bacterium]